MNREIARIGDNNALADFLQGRQAVAATNTRAERQLLAGGDRLRKLDDDVNLQRALRDASAPVEGEPLENQIVRLNQAERSATQAADNGRYAHRTDWTEVPVATPRTAGVYTPVERGLLEDAYRTRRALAGIADARLTGEQRLAYREAVQTIKDITTLPRPGVRLRPPPARDGTVTMDAGALSETVDDLTAATTPHLPTFDRTVTGRPAANTVQRAKVTRQVVAEHVAQAGQMIEAGLVDAADIADLNRRVGALGAALDAYEAGATPFLRGEIEQLSGDLARWGAVLSSYRTAVDAGVTAGNQVGAFVAGGHLAGEAAHIADQTVQHQAVIAATDLDGQMSRELERIRLQDEYDTQRQILEAAGDGRTKRAARERVTAAAAKLESLRPTALGPLDDDVDSIFAAGNALLEDLTGGPDLFTRAAQADVTFNPLQERFRLEALVPRLDAEHTRLAADNTALAAALTRTTGDRVSYIPVGATKATTMPRAVAEETLAANERAADEWFDVLRRNSDSLQVLDGRAAKEVGRLRAIDSATVGPEVAEQAQRRLAELEPLMTSYGRLVGEDNWVVDAGQQRLTGMIAGDTPVDPAVLRQMLGHETGEYAATWIRTFNELVAGREVLDGNEMTALGNELAAVFGDNDLVAAIIRAPDLDAARAELSRSLTGAAQTMAQGTRSSADHIYATLGVRVASRTGACRPARPRRAVRRRPRRAAPPHRRAAGTFRLGSACHRRRPATRTRHARGTGGDDGPRLADLSPRPSLCRRRRHVRRTCHTGR